MYCRKLPGVTKAEMSDVCGVKGTCQYPFNMSSLLMYVAGPISSIQSSIRGNGWASGTVTAFTLRKSVQNVGLPSDFVSKRQGELQGLELATAN